MLWYKMDQSSRHITQTVWTTMLWDSAGRGQLKCDGTRVEIRFHLSAKWKSPFKSAGASVQSTTGSQVLRISGSNAGYTVFRGSVKSTGYPPHSPVSHSLPLPCVTVCHHISTGLYIASSKANSPYCAIQCPLRHFPAPPPPFYKAQFPKLYCARCKKRVS